MFATTLSKHTFWLEREIDRKFGSSDHELLMRGFQVPSTQPITKALLGTWRSCKGIRSYREKNTVWKSYQNAEKHLGKRDKSSMGNVLAAEVPNLATPVLVPPPPTSPPTGPPPPTIPGQEGGSEDTGPGTFEDLHKKCKGNTICRSTNACCLQFSVILSTDNSLYYSAAYCDCASVLQCVSLLQTVQCCWRWLCLFESCECDAVTVSVSLTDSDTESETDWVTDSVSATGTARGQVSWTVTVYIISQQ